MLRTQSANSTPCAATNSTQASRQLGSEFLAIDSVPCRCDCAQIRHLQFHEPGARGASAAAPMQTGPLGPEQAALVAAADTFFIATHFCSPGGPALQAQQAWKHPLLYAASHLQNATLRWLFSISFGRPSGNWVTPKGSAGVTALTARRVPAEAGAASGSDVSHRGGPPGFVQLAADRGTLRWADYIGNDMFNTLGNILSNGEAALLFIDFARGGTLRLTGTASIDLADRSLPGAQRALAFRIERWAHERAALPVTAAGPPEYSPYNPRDAAGAEQRRYARLVRVADAAAGIKTFTFAWPEAAVRTSRPEPFAYQAGMYASFDFHGMPGASGTVNRTWTISSHPDESAATGTFSISVKKAGPVSTYLHRRALNPSC